MKKLIALATLITSTLAFGATGSISAPLPVTTTSAAYFVPVGQIRLSCTQPTYYKVVSSSSGTASSSDSLNYGTTALNGQTISRPSWITITSNQWLALIVRSGVSGYCTTEQMGDDGAAASVTTLAASGAVTLSSTLAVTGASTLTGAVTMSAAATVGTTLDVTGAATAASVGLPSSTVLAGLKFGTVTLASASPSTATATVLSGMNCVCTNQTTQANPVKCAVSSTTLTVTGPNTVTDVVSYLCFK